jgi:hypothetical protein
MNAPHPASAFAPRLAVAHMGARSGAFVPRKTRMLDLGRRASQRRMANPPPGEQPSVTALKAAEAWIETTFSIGAIHNRTKATIEYFMRLGAWSMDTRLRYHVPAGIADGRSLDVSLRALDHQLFAHRLDNRQRKARGVPQTPVDDRLVEARLFARWFRRHGAAELWPEIIDALTTPPHAAPPQVHFADEVA